MIEEYKILPARIAKFYKDTQTADVKISAERIFSNYDGKNQVEERELIIGVPVHTPFGGGWSITFPIAVGDTCLIVFSQVGYDHWLYKDKDKGGLLIGRPVPHLMRSWSESDGFALVGFNTLPRAIGGYNGTGSEWRNTDSKQKIALNVNGDITINSEVSVSITAPQINITGNLSVTGTTIMSGDASIGGISFLGHHHTGDSGGNTSPPI